ncbi:uncharacterized protein M421DRAFT_178140 [Didymella exigua CBS 183.55]|uniref:Uncharacterized protein n=1 Tax=Didymella exigua CBS 183.55 TaxID=1150837 RepID=A0A6A5RJU3_9PLEO|nr:uncharacterized protein M421DRAFT_178140 [Didymella exigua CBS 183.55]KAF1927378.1 hypothetical protein M421DRAFT_178140 [Didymella exigua CBS 183.55]
MQSLHFDHHQPDRSSNQTHTHESTPPPVAFLPSQHADGNSTQNYQQNLSFPPTDHNHHTNNYGTTASLGLINLPHLPSSGCLTSTSAGRSMQYDQLYFQIQTLRQQSHAHEIEMARRDVSQNRMGLAPAPPSFGVSGPLNRGGQGSIQTQGHSSMPSFQAPYSRFNPNGSVLVLRVHSNTYDQNGQPIFSILRMHTDEIFGPRLHAYCANRGKEFGVDWIFVYRYRIGTYQSPGHDMQITLTWDMTPADMKGDDIPGIAMRNMETIYVMKVKTPAIADIKREISEDGAVQSPGPQVSHQIAHITNGETKYFQNPDVTRQWYQAIQKDNAHLRASHHQMQTVITQLRQELLAKKQENTELTTNIAELTKMSKEYREMVERRASDPTVPDPGPQVAQFSLSRPPAGRVARQRPGPPNQPVQQRPARQRINPTAEYYRQRAEQQDAQLRAQTEPNAFLKKCEAVRDPNEQVPHQLQPLQFPSFESGSTVPDSTQQLSMDFAFDGQASTQGRSYDAADTVVKSGVEATEE